MLGGLSCVMLLSAPAGAQRERRILMLHAYNFMHKAASLVGASARERLLERSRDKLVIDADFLDLIRNATPEKQEEMARHLAAKYRGLPLDLVMTVGGEAFPFLLKYRHIIAPGVPAVFASVSRANYAAQNAPRDVTGIIIELDLAKTISLAERLQPKATDLYLVAGSAPIDRRWQGVARKVVQAWAGKYRVHELFELPIERLLAEVAALPPDAIVVMLTVFVDGTGKSVVPGEVGQAVARASPAPVYSSYTESLGRGILGGYSETFEDHGIAAADLALKILDGADPADLPPRSSPLQAYRVDVNALRRWNLSESDLPAGTAVLFREPSLWQRHRSIVLGTLLVIAVLLALVALLLLQRHRRKKIQEALRTSEERMAFAAKSINAGLWQYDPSKKQFWGTDHCRALLGLDGDTPLTPETLLGAIHPDQRELVRGFLDGESGLCEPHGLDLHVPRRDGSSRWLSVRSQSRPGDTAGDGQLRGIIVDITDRKIAEAEISARRQEVAHLMRVSLVGELSGAIAHEINQPLAAVQSNAHAALDMIRERTIELGELRDTLTDIVSENHRASEVVTRLRGLLKRGEARTETIHINGLIEDTIKLVSNDAASRGVTFRHSLAEGLPDLEGDAVQIQQVLLNLLMNAMDSTLPETDRLVAIATDMTEVGEVRIKMTDTGQGIGPGDLHRVFEPFYTTKEHGLGLGLSICTTIVQSHGGHLTVENGPEKGAVATLLLPLATANAPAP